MARFFFTQAQNIELIVENGKPMGGAVIATHAWMQALHELGNEIVLGRQSEDQRPIKKEFEWIKEHKVFYSNKGIPVIRWVYYRFPKIFLCLKKIKPDFVIESIPSWTSPFNGIICKILGIKQILRLANDNMLDERIKVTHGTFEQKFIFLGIRNCDYIMVQNQYQLGILKEKFPKQKIIKISNPFIINKDFLTKKMISEGYIAWVANFRFQKNLKLLFQISKEFPNEIFYIAGQPSKHIDPETSEYLAKLKDLKNVVFVGNVPREEILTFFKKAKFLLNTSRYEGFSNTFLEAMNTGTPILSTRNVNPDNIIDGYGLGYIFKDIHELKRFMENVDQKKYESMSTNCIEYIKKNHDHLNLGIKFLEFLNKP